MYRQVDAICFSFPTKSQQVFNHTVRDIYENEKAERLAVLFGTYLYKIYIMIYVYIYNTTHVCLSLLFPLTP